MRHAAPLLKFFTKHVDEALFEALICSSAREFQQLLDRKTHRDEILFSDIKVDVVSDGQADGKDDSVGLVTH